MLGALTTLIFCLGITGLGRFLFGRALTALDPALAIGVGGILGLGSVGLLTLFIGLIPGGFAVGVFLVWALAIFGLYRLWVDRAELKFLSRAPRQLELALALLLVLCVGFALVGVLCPSATLDWDTIAYHLAVPKLYLQAGHIYPISFIHQSNFPLSVDALYIWGLMWGDQQGAKAFELAFYLLGMISVFGLARSRYGSVAGAFATLAFATVPVVLWESGTAYIDVAHGLYAGLGAALAFLAVSQGRPSAGIVPETSPPTPSPPGDPPSLRSGDLRQGRGTSNLLIAAALCLGFAVGTKYTGLESLFAACLVLFLCGFRVIGPGRALKAAVLVGVVAIAVGSPWYIKNAVWKGNPVFPFFYERFGGKDWDQFRADIYREEQQSFGVKKSGHLAADLKLIPDSVLGLAYAPDRYINQMPLWPMGAVGVALLAAFFYWLFSGRSRLFEGQVLLWTGLSLLMWFVLTQQSRYIVSLAPPLAVLAGGAVQAARRKQKAFDAGLVVGAATVIQAVFTVWVAAQILVKPEVPGLSAPEDYLTKNLAFYPAAKAINETVKQGKVALFDEVFGFYLNVPYFWANPGHSTEIGYERIETGDQFADRLKAMGFTHAYVNLRAEAPADRDRFIAAMGVQGAPQPWSADEQKGMDADLRSKWRRLFADAVAAGRFRMAQAFKGGILFEIS